MLGFLIVSILIYNIMKLLSFKASNVYHQFNFELVFKSDITILYGINGCGKTTVLKMINLIISGKIYDLKDIKFGEAVLNYKHEGKEYFLKFYNTDTYKIHSNHKIIDQKLKKININIQPKKERKIKAYQELTETFNEIFNAIFISIDRKVQKSISSLHYYDKNFNKFLHRYVEKDIESLKDLEIDRYYNIYRREFVNRYIYENKQIEDGKPISNLNPIDEVANLISTKYRDFQKYCILLDHKYQQESYKKMISLKKIDEIKNKLLEFDNKSIVKAKERIFNQSKYFMDEVEIPEEKDFERLISGFEIQNEKVQKGRDISGDYLVNFIQFLKLDESSILLEKNNQEKEEKYIPFKLLIDNLNDFFSVTKKEAILIDEKIKFKLRNDELIEPNNLSSGEKQILIFFTYLIFNEHDNQEPVILYDEPDLSLHLDWQEKFVESIFKINPTIQIILATHSPGIGSEKFDNHSISLENSFPGE